MESIRTLIAYWHGFMRKLTKMKKMLEGRAEKITFRTPL
jgi:hypothetical protein